VVNRYVEVALEPTGALTLVDRATRTRWSGLLRVESGGDIGDAYTFQAPGRDRLARSAGPVRVHRIAAGPLVAALEARWRLRCGWGMGGHRRGHVDLRLVVTLHADSPAVRCLLEIDNQARDHRLRARMPLGLPGAPLVAGSAFTTIDRPPATATRAESPLEAPATTAPAHRYVAVAPVRSDARGLGLLAPGFFEYEWTPGGDLLVTLLRAVGQLSRNDLAARPGHAAWPTPVPEAQCAGHDRIELALVPVSAGALGRGDALPRHWEDVFVPLRGAWLRDARRLRPAAGDATLDGTGLVLSAVKPAQAGGGTVLRCYNATARAAAGTWRFGAPVRAAYRVRADERESVPLVLEDRGRAVRFTAGPHEIVTLMVE
jgi:alpha-mannosidase